MLDSPSVIPEDKQKIRELLKKPWNPYVRRHTGLTEKSLIPELLPVFNQYAGWTQGSTMAQKYLHYFGNESNHTILEAYGILPKEEKQLSDTLKPRQCPNCNEPNKPDSKFCAKCRMVLTYDAYSETLESEKQNEDRVSVLEKQMQSLITTLGNLKEPVQINTVAKTLYNSGILKRGEDDGTK